MQCRPRNDSARQWTVPLFPLPNFVLFPGVVSALHIFEERYKAMTADAIKSDRPIAMALLQPGWEKDYYGKPAIEPVVCVGQIAQWERLDDGCYNFLLHGMARAKVVSEESRSLYRTIVAEELAEECASEPELAGERRELAAMFDTGPLASLPLSDQIRKFLSSPLTTGMVADLIAFHALAQLSLKQSLLAEINVKRRVRRVIAAMHAAVPVIELANRGTSRNAHYN
jgi:Lon protease-like protein